MKNTKYMEISISPSFILNDSKSKPLEAEDHY